MKTSAMCKITLCSKILKALLVAPKACPVDLLLNASGSDKQIKKNHQNPFRTRENIKGSISEVPLWLIYDMIL